MWSYILAAVGITGLWIAGRGGPHVWIGWAVGLASQALWAAYAFTTSQPGFLISCAAYGTVHARNLYRARKALAASHQRRPETSPERGLATVTHE